MQRKFYKTNETTHISLNVFKIDKISNKFTLNTRLGCNRVQVQ